MGWGRGEGGGYVDICHLNTMNTVSLTKLFSLSLLQHQLLTPSDYKLLMLTAIY